MKRASMLLIVICLIVIMYTPTAADSHIAASETASSFDNPYQQDIIVYAAHQDWLSRIYILDINGNVLNYFEYDFYYFCDLELVDGEIYAAEAFAPRVYKIDIETGELDVFIDDWSLFYFYDVAFDGEYFYVTEWDLNRYDINGDKDGTASFDADAMGGAWDGEYYWTTDDAGQITCWDISNWQSVTEVPANNFAAPTSSCRGLWYDGRYFWSAESKDQILGKIYQFDHSGNIIQEWNEPAYRGWSACIMYYDQPSIFVDMIPHDPPIEVPAGGSFTYTGILQNNTDSSQTVDLWVMLDVPDYGMYGPVLRYNNLTLTANDSISRNINQSVPNFAPVGLYDYIAYAGNYPDEVIDSSSFEFTVINPGMDNADDWKCTGWLDSETNKAQTEIRLSRYPNPFNDRTNFSFNLNKESMVRLDIYNIMGQRIATLMDGRYNRGSHNISWNAEGFPSGVYFYHFSIEDQSVSGRVILLK
ncbi:MAG: T9SS type A sorting domain-containing protein [candidate division Zixibacteria bacterium]|nr:T9SS type A sorting domain-containing protein [candidate division Zixibacteria bacterium]